MLTHQYPVHTVKQNMIVDIFNDKLPNPRKNQLCNELVNKYVGRAGESAEKENFLITIVRKPIFFTENMLQPIVYPVLPSFANFPEPQNSLRPYSTELLHPSGWFL